MRVFHGISGAAGQPASIVSALREHGVDASNYVLGENKYGFDFDRRLKPEGEANTYFFQLLESELLDFDVFHFYFRSLFFDHKRASYPAGLDLILLRLAGKRVIMNFRGSEVRLHSEFRKLSPFHYVDEDPDELVSKFPEDIQRKQIELCNALCNHVLVPDPELQSYVPNSTIVARSIDLSKWQPKPNSTQKPLKIVHAPSRQAVKGSDAVLSAIRQLQSEGLNFEFSLVEGVTNEQARQMYAESDIVVDQLRIGWYGVLAVEGMALQKCVVSFVRDDLKNHLGENPPIAIADPNSIQNTLRELITNHALRESIAKRGRIYCEQVHDSNKVAQQLIEIYASEGKELNPKVVAQHLGTQYNENAESQHNLTQQVSSLERELRIVSRELEKKTAHLDHLQHRLRFFYWLRDKIRR